ncbi:hypothetical protein D3C85_1090800 [compost metagenome]
MQWLRVDGELKLFSSAGTLLLFAAEGGVSLSVDGQRSEVLGQHDCLHLEASGELAELTLSARGAACCLIELTPR